MPFRRKPAEEKTARRQAKERRKVEARERLTGVVQETRRTEEEKRQQALTALLQPGEEVEAQLKTADFLSKYVLLTSARLIVAPARDVGRAESILYRAITGFGTANFITRDVKLEIVGRRERLELRFKTDEERAEALRVLQAHVV